MGWSVHEGVAVVVHAPGEPTDAAFDEWLSDMRAATIRGLVVVAPHAKLSAKQRKQVQHWFLQSKARGAVITNSTVARGVVTAISWFKVPIRAFAPGDLTSAFEYASVAPHERSGVEQAMRRLERVMWTNDKQVAG
jgi:hypothetical protein